MVITIHYSPFNAEMWEDAEKFEEMLIEAVTKEYPGAYVSVQPHHDIIVDGTQLHPEVSYIESIVERVYGEWLKKSEEAE
jgi:hypothetical protein